MLGALRRSAEYGSKLLVRGVINFDEEAIYLSVHSIKDIVDEEEMKKKPFEVREAYKILRGG